MDTAVSNMPILDADEALRELNQLPAVTHAPTMGKLQKVRYTHQAMIDLMISNPWISQDQLAAHFGYTPGWVSNVLAADSFQVMLAARREEIVDPALKATMEERFRALTIRSLQRLEEKLNKPVVSDQVVLRAVELGAKALGIGGNAAPPAPPTIDLDRLAGRLIALKRKTDEKEVQGEVVLSKESETD